MPTKKANIVVLKALEDRFEVLEGGLVYVDSPLEGFLREISGERIFAFRVTTIVEDHLWHWTLLPVDNASSSVEDVFTLPVPTATEWVSIVEDRRGESTTLTVASFTRQGPSVPKGVLTH